MLKKMAHFIVQRGRIIEKFFIAMTILCAVCYPFVGVNYDLSKYLPDFAPTKQALDVMEQEFGYPGMARIMVKDVTLPEARTIRQRISRVDGVDLVVGPDLAANVYSTDAFIKNSLTDRFYKDGNAVYQIIFEDGDSDASTHKAINEIYGIVGKDRGCFAGSAVSSKERQESITREIAMAIGMAVVIIWLILTLTTTSWFEPFLFILVMAVAIVLNMGSNIMFGRISFFTFSTAAILQLAVSMDYSIFLLHRFAENRSGGLPVEKAMTEAVQQSVGSILSSGLTTVTGFLALVLMRFKIGPDMGWVMSKAIGFSLLSVLCFLPALAIATYRLIDRTQHRSFVPKFDKFAAVVMKIRFPVLALIVLLPASFLGQQNNDFFYGGSEVYSTEATQMGRDMQAINSMYGPSNPVVLMVPKGDMEKEISMNEELKKLDYVTSVVSYVNSVGNTIPDSFLPTETVSKLYSAHYSRFVITLEAAEKDADWYEKINDIRNIGEKYYGDKIQYAGNLVSTEDLKTTITQDNARVNFLAIAFVFLILLVNFKSLTLPVILTLVIESSIWINLGIPYFQGQTLFYIGYLIISTVQLGATIDYAILFSDRYMEFRRVMPGKEAARETLRVCTVSILTSAAVLTLAGIILGKVSTNGVLSQLGILIGRGAALSFVLVIFVLPTLLLLFDGVIRKTTLHCRFYRAEPEKKD